MECHIDPVLGVTTEAVVAVQTIVNEFTGDIASADLTAQPSSVAPAVETMLGQSKNSDGTQTWGSANLELAPNAAVQVTFSMAMSRGSIENGISISPTVNGHWAVSSDWLSATFYLDAGASLTAGQAYTVTVNGADASGTAVTNVYGNKLALSATGSFAIAAQAHGVASIAQAAVASYGPFLHRYFDIPEDRLILCAISFGYADPDHPANGFRTDRADANDIISWHNEA